MYKLKMYHHSMPPIALMSFKQLITPAITDWIVRAGADLLNSSRRTCKKVSYTTPASANKALKKHGYALGCKQYYKCTKHGTDEVYHLTSMKTNLREK